MQRSALCRSRRELSNEYLLAKIGVDTAENEPLEVWGKIIQYYSFVSLFTNVGQVLPTFPPTPPPLARPADGTEAEGGGPVRPGFSQPGPRTASPNGERASRRTCWLLLFFLLQISAGFSRNTTAKNTYQYMKL